MKKVSTILSHISNQPQFKYLKQEDCYKKYVSLLSAKWQKAIAFIYVKNDTLFVAVTHPGFKMELNYNRDLLKSILTQMLTLMPDCEKMQADKVVVFHSKYRSAVKDEAPLSTVPYYAELSSSHFEVSSEDEELQEKFNTTKALIKAQLP